MPLLRNTLLGSSLILLACGNFTKVTRTSKPAPQLSPAAADVEILWVGHATVLMRIFDKWIITDPNFSSRTGAVVKRLSEPGIDTASLRPVDAILISHSHFDHLDRPSLHRLKGSVQIYAPESSLMYVPSGIARIQHGVNNGYSNEEEGLNIIAVPVSHFGGRLFLDNLWDGDPYTGYIIQYRGITVFFAGDTGYDPQKFTELGELFKIDIALIPVGPAGGFGTGSGLGNSVHVNPYGALQIFRDCKAKFMIPIHHSTFYRRGGREMEMILDAIAISGQRDSMRLLSEGESIWFNRGATGLDILPAPEMLRK
jgi:L-ascorbate metabolism protein UlaG (beta-lactamase superfamily)